MMVEEGLARIEVDEARIAEERRATGFYNPEMRENRDIAVLALRWFGREYGKGVALDAFAATGVRGLRFEKEAGWDVVATEVNERAFRRLKRNIATNGSSVEAKLKDCRREMMDGRFRAVDIDPYGSPSQFIEFSALALEKPSLLMVTATDTANLFGVYPRKCDKLYGIPSERKFSPKEIGTRILLSHVIRELGKYDKAFLPLLSFSIKHYVRLMGLVRKSSTAVYSLLEQFGEWNGRRIYLGPLKDNAFMDSIIEDAGELETMESGTIALLGRIRDELDVPFYYDTHRMGIRKGLAEIREIVEDEGYRFSRTHFCNTAFKTDMPADMLEELLGR